MQFLIAFMIALVMTFPAQQGQAATYYLAPASLGGSDSHPGTFASPWLTPDHAVNCGDTITAIPSSAYAESQFGYRAWGSVAGSGHCVARLTCAVFDTCKLISHNGFGIWVTASHWMIDGWEVTATNGQAICFEAYPPTPSASLQDIIFADDIANGCYGAGFEPVPNGSAGTDYFVLIGDIAYNAAQDVAECGSAISVFKPVNVDAAPGTHIYISQTFTWGNLDPPICAGGPSTDGEGIIIDTLAANGYTSQVAIENNIALFNGSLGFEVWNNGSAPVSVLNNTAVSDLTSAFRSTGLCGEIGAGGPVGQVEFWHNIARTNVSRACGGNVAYAYVLQNAHSTVSIHHTLGYSPAGENTSCQSCSGFFLGTDNIFGNDPRFADPPSATPSTPSCSGKMNVIACVANIIADLKPTSSMVPAGWGYQPPSASAIYDPLFPHWLCNVNLPSGLVTMGCAPPAQSQLPASVARK